MARPAKNWFSPGQFPLLTTAPAPADSAIIRLIRLIRLIGLINYPILTQRPRYGKLSRNTQASQSFWNFSMPASLSMPKICLSVL